MYLGEVEVSVHLDPGNIVCLDVITVNTSSTVRHLFQSFPVFILHPILFWSVIKEWVIMKEIKAILEDTLSYSEQGYGTQTTRDLLKEGLRACHHKLVRL